MALGLVLGQRPFRVFVLVVAIASMSAVDLYLTLLYVTHMGMTELNPLARAIMDYQSPLVLVVWKTATVVLSVGILLVIRKQRSAEIGAWAGCLVLGWLMSHWVVFVHETRNFDIEVAHAIGMDDPSWVMIGGAHTGVLPTRTVID